MPPRWASVAILLGWAVMAVGLIRRDILPDLLIGPPPDLRSIAAVNRADGPTRWILLVHDDPNNKSGRPIGRAVTESLPLDDGGLKLTSRTTLDADALLQSTRFSGRASGKVEVDNSIEIGPTGNLRRIDAVVREAGVEEPLMKVRGEVVNDRLVIETIGPIAVLNIKKAVPYAPKGLIQNALGPIDRMPGLAVGQRWESRVVSPLTGKLDVIASEVTRRADIFWGGGLVSTYEVVQTVPPTLSARTWVRRSDGLVLRQEVPIPLVPLMIEREP